MDATTATTTAARDRQREDPPPEEEPARKSQRIKIEFKYTEGNSSPELNRQMKQEAREADQLEAQANEVDVVLGERKMWQWKHKRTGALLPVDVGNELVTAHVKVHAHPEVSRTLPVCT